MNERPREAGMVILSACLLVFIGAMAAGQRMAAPAPQATDAGRGGTSYTHIESDPVVAIALTDGGYDCYRPVHPNSSPPITNGRGEARWMGAELYEGPVHCGRAK